MKKTNVEGCGRKNDPFLDEIEGLLTRMSNYYSDVILEWDELPSSWIASIPGRANHSIKHAASPVPRHTNILANHLLAHGGKKACLLKHENSECCAVLFIDGKIFSTKGMRVLGGFASQCLPNSILYCMRKKGQGYNIGYGYALSAEDKMWRSHAWVVSRDGTIIETTVRHKMYYGFIASLNDFFHQSAPPHGGRQPAEGPESDGPGRV